MCVRRSNTAVCSFSFGFVQLPQVMVRMRKVGTYTTSGLQHDEEATFLILAVTSCLLPQNYFLLYLLWLCLALFLFVWLLRFGSQNIMDD